MTDVQKQRELFFIISYLVGIFGGLIVMSLAMLLHNQDIVLLGGGMGIGWFISLVITSIWCVVKK